MQTQTDSVDSPFRSPLEALKLATVSLERMLGLPTDEAGEGGERNWVATSRAGLLDVEAKVVAIGTGKDVLLF